MCNKIIKKNLKFSSSGNELTFLTGRVGLGGIGGLDGEV